jgi:hypothetical protein
MTDMEVPGGRDWFRSFEYVRDNLPWKNVGRFVVYVPELKRLWIFRNGIYVKSDNYAIYYGPRLDGILIALKASQ